MPHPQVPFGAPMRNAYFTFSQDYLPLNQGSFGTFPTPVRAANLAFRAELEGAPDPFISHKTPGLLAKSRALTAAMLNADADDVAFTPNATTGLDTILKNIHWEAGDVVVCYEIVYGAVASGIAWICENHGAEVYTVTMNWPISDDELIEKYVEAVRKINREGNGKRRVRAALCDTVVSMPGVRIPYEKLVPALQSENALVILDAAHGIGQVDINVKNLKPDFMVTNLHKWLFVPRGCAALYVPKQHQWMIRTSLPTSLGFVQKPLKGAPRVENPLPGGSGNPFVALFEFTGTIDNTNYMCVPEAIRFRNEICGGEKAIRTYCQNIAREAGDRLAALFNTEVLDHPSSRMRECFFANVRVPLTIGESPGHVKPEHAPLVQNWLKLTAAQDEGTYFQTIFYRGAWWWRISGAIYLELEDYLEGARRLLRLCERIKAGELGKRKVKL